MTVPSFTISLCPAILPFWKCLASDFSCERVLRSALKELHRLLVALVHAARTRKMHRAEQSREVCDVLVRARRDIDGVLSSKYKDEFKSSPSTLS
jgi:hypothetical protein